MIPHQLTFSSFDEVTPVLYLGKQKASKPHYDMARLLNDSSKADTALAELGKVVRNPLFGQGEITPIPWTEKHKILLWLVLGAVVVALGTFILKSFTSIQNQ